MDEENRVEPDQMASDKAIPSVIVLPVCLGLFGRQLVFIIKILDHIPYSQHMSIQRNEKL